MNYCKKIKIPSISNSINYEKKILYNNGLYYSILPSIDDKNNYIINIYYNRDGTINKEEVEMKEYLPININIKTELVITNQYIHDTYGNIEFLYEPKQYLEIFFTNGKDIDIFIIYI